MSPVDRAAMTHVLDAGTGTGIWAVDLGKLIRVTRDTERIEITLTSWSHLADENPHAKVSPPYPRGIRPRT